MPLYQRKQQPTDQLPYTIRNVSDESAEILIYDVIGRTWDGEGTTAKQFVKDLAAISGKKLTVRINSPGGNVFDGLAIYNALKTAKGKKEVVIDGLAASMASVIAMAGDRVTMRENALMMVHNPVGYAYGDAKAMRDYADMLDKSKRSIMQAYVAKSGMDSDGMSALMDAETWMDADEAKAAGLVDDVAKDDIAMAAQFTLDDFPRNVHVPDELRDRVRDIISRKPEEKPMPEPTPVPATQQPPKATIEQLESLKGATPEFILGCLKAGNTYDQAVAALNESLFAQLEAMKAQQATQPQQPQAPEAKVESSPTQQQETQTQPRGTAPIASSKPAGSTDGQPATPWGSDPVGFHRTELRKLVAEYNGNAVEAAKAVVAKYPGLEAALADLHQAN